MANTKPLLRAGEDVRGSIAELLRNHNMLLRLAPTRPSENFSPVEMKARPPSQNRLEIRASAQISDDSLTRATRIRDNNAADVKNKIRVTRASGAELDL